MSDIGYNDDVKAYGRKFHIQTASHRAKGTASVEVVEGGRVISKSYLTYERRNESSEEKMEKRIREIVESVHRENKTELELLYVIAEKINSLGHAPSHVKLGLLFIKTSFSFFLTSRKRLGPGLITGPVRSHKSLQYEKIIVGIKFAVRLTITSTEKGSLNENAA